MKHQFRFIIMALVVGSLAGQAVAGLDVTYARQISVAQISECDGGSVLVLDVAELEGAGEYSETVAGSLGGVVASTQVSSVQWDDVELRLAGQFSSQAHRSSEGDCEHDLVYSSASAGFTVDSPATMTVVASLEETLGIGDVWIRLKDWTDNSIVYEALAGEHDDEFALIVGHIYTIETTVESAMTSSGPFDMSAAGEFDIVVSMDEVIAAETLSWSTLRAAFR